MATVIELDEVKLRRAHVALRVNQFINNLQTAVARAGLGEDELAALERHAAAMERRSDEDDPEGYAEMVATDGFARLNKRIALIRAARELAEMDRKAMAVLAGSENANV